VTEAELKQFITLEVHALVTPLLSGAHCFSRWVEEVASANTGE
jgi:hypothetical protein